MNQPKLILVGYRPGKKSQIIKRTDVLVKHNNGWNIGKEEVITFYGNLKNPIRVKVK